MRAVLEAASSPLPAATLKRLRRLSVVMPAYNEEDVLPVALAEAVAALDLVAAEWELLVLGTPAKDVNCAFKLFRRSFFDRVRLPSDGFLIDAELYARSRRAGMKVARVGVTHRPRTAGSSTVKTSTVAATLWELWRLRRSLAS